jgi:light-regulated signal transduction histidine kinase (bacteriophytochrome)
MRTKRIIVLGLPLIASFLLLAIRRGFSEPLDRSIIESHGGRLGGTSSSGRGATFQFTLPGTVATHV